MEEDCSVADMANDSVAVTRLVLLLLLMVMMTIAPIGDFGFRDLRG